MCVKMYLMGNSVLCIAKSFLFLLCDSHDCCDVFIASVTMHYLSCIMGAKCRSPRLLGSGLGKQGCPSERQSICLMPNCSLTNTPDGISGGLTDPSSYTACSYMPPGRDRKRQRGSSERGSYSIHLVLADELCVEVGGNAMLEEDLCGVAVFGHQPVCHPEDQCRSHKRRSPHDKALQEAREAHQQVLEATCIMELDIKRLSQEVENVLHWSPPQPQWQPPVEQIPQ